MKALFSLLFIFVMIFCFYSPDVLAVPSGDRVTYEGNGAGEVVFDGAAHARKGLTCATCHEERGILPALFDMKKHTNPISMRRIEIGLSCGECHVVSMKDMSSCSICHHK